MPVIPYILPAGTDGRTLTELCPCVLRFAPLRLTAQQLDSVHSENENVDITAIGACIMFFRRLLERDASRWEDADLLDDLPDSANAEDWNETEWDESIVWETMNQEEEKHEHCEK